MNQNDHPDHLELARLLAQAKPLMAPMFPDQQKKWVADSPLAQEIAAILVKHPEYYDEIRSHVGGIFPRPKVKCQRIVNSEVLEISGLRTTRTESEIVRLALETGAYVVKTSMTTELLFAIRESFQGRIFVSPEASAV